MVVGCGRPLSGIEVEVINEDGRILPERWVGEIVVRGTSLAPGYFRQAITVSSTRFSDEALYTGDAGFILDGELFVLGRLGDSMKVRGRIIFGEDLEAAVSSLGIPREHVAALLGVHRGESLAVLIIERGHNWPASLEAVVRREVGGTTAVLVDAPRGTILRTTSGKPRRRELWQAFVSGTLPGVARPTAHGPLR
jgi:acyl-CoA synthetase (AMP-forming)/AMP-acid ligase II